MISVIIPTYYRYDLVNRAIDSVLKQTYKDFEIIVVDDCSPDVNYEKLKDRTDISYYRMEKRSGSCAVARNLGIRKSKGKWIAFLDDDDFWFPHKLERQMQWSEEYDFICSDAYCNGTLWIKDRGLQAWNQLNPFNTNELDYSIICKTNFIIGSSVLIKKEILESVGLVQESPFFFGMEDYATWLEVLKYGNSCFFIDEGLLEYNTISVKHY